MTTVDTISAALIEAHRADKRMEANKLPEPDYGEALEIQQRVQSKLGAVSGFKVVDRGDAPPLMAPITAARTVPSGSSVPVRDKLGIELEIGFELIAEPAPEMMDKPNAFFRPRIVIELVDTRLDGDAAAMQKLADTQINAGLVVGPALEAWDGCDFGVMTAALRCGDEQVIDGEASVPGGSALSNLALFCASVGTHCGGLQKGQIVITGSLSGLDYFAGGRDVAGKIKGIGEIALRLE
ncbi:hydratase [Tropicimonas sp. TH_r6]|uniref:hydratase n=1 Tax=Tropicimonas sp. TH_r6 TaxID=3082085 RepID=UPI002954FCCA|nr:hydratase [Tropicimonas sp. TH_r6]MDV7145902.1 hydratase [Tropicimonas sp. TH_r6]